MFGKKSRKLVSFSLLSLFMFAPNFYYNNDIMASRFNLKDLEKKKKEIEKELSKKKANLSAHRAKQSGIKKNISEVESEIFSINESISKISQEILDSDSEIEKLGSDVQNRKENLKGKVAECGKCLNLIYKDKVPSVYELFLSDKDYKKLEYKANVAKRVWDRFQLLLRSIREDLEKINQCLSEAKKVKERKEKKISDIKEKEQALEKQMNILGAMYKDSQQQEKKIVLDLDGNNYEMREIEREIKECKRRMREEAMAKARRAGANQGVKKSSDFIPDSAGILLWPTKGFRRITTYFAEPAWRSSKSHGAIDIAGAGINGTPIRASADMFITYAAYGYNGGYGNHIRSEFKLNGQRYQVRYGHLSSISVTAGQFVKKGEIIGRVGSTGRSTGPHLHFEILKHTGKNWVRIDPLGFKYNN